MPLLPTDDYGHHIQALRPGTAQAVAIAATSTASAPFGATTTVVRAVATAPCFLVLGRSPVATQAGHYLPADAPEYFRVVPGESLAAIRATGDGTLHLSEML
ncbi:hypothetical protein [Azospirillum rugosum]|uniref:Uncharacterized protein n=1 Tax=Azospirillum rugosum TaxID=416170 RepID=A0ABS4SQ71_9PROT|nr:hypothetical protein [Azospirillum rugosum]MBP2294248.1 hypothetical protein [Azospirillum rugosum]MDQ0527583.1 hypothetical protein [Azospirillum rugosum]